jgi:hypothetical protein
MKDYLALTSFSGPAGPDQRSPSIMPALRNDMHVVTAADLAIAEDIENSPSLCREEIFTRTSCPFP